MKTCPTKDEFLKQMAKDHGLDANGVAEAARLYDKISGMAEAVPVRPVAARWVRWACKQTPE